MKHSESRFNLSSRGFKVLSLFFIFAFLASTYYMVSAIKGYSKPKPLIISPSSVDQMKSVGDAIYKSLYPLAKQGYGIKFSNESAFPKELRNTLFNKFGLSKKLNISFSYERISLDQKIDPKNMDCKTTALFNMKRRIKKWKKKLFFAVCKNSHLEFQIFITSNREPSI